MTATTDYLKTTQSNQTSEPRREAETATGARSAATGRTDGVTVGVLERVTTTDLGLLAMRLMVGWVFIFHGSQKLFGWFGGGGISGTAGFMEKLGMPLPTLSAYAAGGAEFVGGLALVTGVLLRWLSVPLAFTMFVAAFTAHWGTFAANAGGMEYPLTLGIVVVGLGLTGPGKLTLSRLFSK